MSHQSLESKLRRFENPVQMLRDGSRGPYVFPIPPEFSNWRDEQESLRDAAVLFDLSFHMEDIYVEGPDTVRLLSHLGINSFDGFSRNRAKQFVACNEDGFVVGDAILLGLEDDKVNISGRPAVPNWVRFHAEQGGYDVEVTRDERADHYLGQRRTFRFQVTGPAANSVLEKVLGRAIDDVPFFHMADLSVAGIPVRGLNHSMARRAGLELIGGAEHRAVVRDAILDAGEEFGLRPAGARMYSTMSTTSGWFASPTPAIYAGEALKPYREWLSADGWEANISLGGSFESDNIADYYQLPWDLGFGRIIKFDHEFVGRAALEKLAGGPHRVKVWLRWNTEDVVRVFKSWLGAGDRFKFMEVPAAYYSTLPFDRVQLGGRVVGISEYVVYSVAAGGWFSLALIDQGHDVDGTEVTVIWGESPGRSANPAVERHVQTEIRATVSTTSPAVSG